MHRLRESDPDIGRAVFQSCRPIAAQRYRDGRLLVVLGCWRLDDLGLLNRESNRERLNNSLGSMLSDRVVTTITNWPGGLVKSSPAEYEGEQIPAPDVLKGLPEDAREEAAKCESVVQRLFFAKAYLKGIRLRCQYPLLNYRLDFAVPERRVGAEIMGWDWRTGPSGAMERRERQDNLEGHGWKVALFSGSQVMADVDKCVATLASLMEASAKISGQPLRRSLSSPRRPLDPNRKYR